MSHNYHKNYTQYSKFNNEPKETELVPDACGLDGCGFDENKSAFNEQSIEGQTTIPEVEPEIPTAEPEILKIGKVYKCELLNVRKLPNRDAKVLSKIAKDSEVMIDEKASTATFYKVCTEHGVEGYCMKAFIKLLS